MLPHLGLPELVIIAVLVLVLFGAGRVGKVGGELGTAIREFRKGLNADDHVTPNTAVPPESWIKCRRPRPLIAKARSAYWHGGRSRPRPYEEMQCVGRGLPRPKCRA